MARELSGLLTLTDYEQAAESLLDAACWAYVAGGADTQLTVRANTEAFDQVWLRPGPSAARA
ncbi:alpha-hydroxy-acid oxidizing protein [Streptomyces sp. SM1P]